jgi:SMODS-associated and fused to various effectors sensor domain
MKGPASYFEGITMAHEITRHIQVAVERELWARAAGRCEFDGCNRLLFKSPVTQEKVNISEKAHIYSFSKKGPRGHGPLSGKQINRALNLMLVCHDCHKKIDQDKKGQRYSGELLRAWKDEHEKRIAIVTGISPTKKSHVVLYAANIADQTSNLQAEVAMAALFPDWYPAEERPTWLSMSWEGRDSDPSYWKTESSNLKAAFNRQIRPLLDGSNCPHLSIFALAPIPLMVLLGSLLTDKVPAQTYQLHREPFQSWKWLNNPADFSFRVKQSKSIDHDPVLVIALSDHIGHERISAVTGKNVSIWELTIDRPHNDFLKSKAQLSLFRETVRKVIVDIGKAHGKHVPLAIFPAMPVACAVELGRTRMPKADSPWVIYDQNNKYKKFIQALEIGDNHE